MNLYIVVIGEYSDRSESWFSHPEKMNQKEFDSLLLNTWKKVTRPRLEKLHNECRTVCIDTFGVEFDAIRFFAYHIQPTEELFKSYVHSGTLEQFQEFHKKYSECWEHMNDCLMKDADFSQVTAEAAITLTPYWRQNYFDDFEKDLLYEVGLEKNV